MERGPRRWIRPIAVLAAVVAAGIGGSVAGRNPGLSESARAPVSASATQVSERPAFGGKAGTAWAGPPRPSPNPPAPVRQDVSPPLRTIPPAPWPSPGQRRVHEEHEIPGPAASADPDPVVQTQVGSAAAPALLTSFEGLGDGFKGMNVEWAPPDDNGAVGPSHYVQVVNTSFAVFSKTGTVLYGPVPTNTIWSGFGGDCQTNNDGDATVVYDRLAGRWVVSQFSVSTTPYLMCFAVSTTGDPTGSYRRYSYQFTSFPDYPKLGVWPDAYYVTLNRFGAGYLGPEVCAYDRAKMLAGAAATQKCYMLSSNYGSLLPADLDGPTAPPAGSPNYLLEVGTSVLHLWKFHVDWVNSANSTLTGPATVPVDSFSPACGSGGVCVPQTETSQKLDSLGDRLMYRLAYRNFGDHESLVTTHSVVAGSAVGVRWYELRNPGGTPTVYQQGTYAPDSTYRWMASAAMDRNGGIAIGYSASSSSIHPGIRYTGRLAGDPSGQMTQGEGVLFSGPGSQTGSQGLNRWGDYTSMSIDPTDDCTFWYTNQYQPSNGEFNWRTRIGSFKLAGCGSGATSDFSISASPTSLSVPQGGSGAITINTAVTSGSAETISLTASGQPAGSVSFVPASVAGGGSSTMTVAVDPAAAVGTYTTTATGTSASATHSVDVTLTVTASAAVANGGFETGTLASWSTAGAYLPRVVTTAHGGSFGAQLGSTSPRKGNSTLKQTVKVPAGSPRLVFWYQPHCTDRIADDQIKMQVRNTAGQTLANVLKVCSNTGTWSQVSYGMSALAGKTVVLWFIDHDDGQPGDPTYFLLDDVSLG
jgi:hypothetical protein